MLEHASQTSWVIENMHDKPGNLPDPDTYALDKIGDTTTTGQAAFGAGGGGGFMFGLHGAGGGAGHQFLHHNSQDDAPDEVLAQQRKEKLLRTGTLLSQENKTVSL